MAERCTLQMIDGELYLIGENNEIIRVFERGDEPLAAYKHMCAWAIAQFKNEIDPESLWAEAKLAWTSLTPETQGLLFALQAREDQMIDDIRLGLLATLAGYQGLKTIKDKFAEAIRSVE
jgi:hypothetical protein